SGLVSSRRDQAANAPAPRVPTARQAARIGSGTTNGGWGQPSLTRAPATSSAPSGEPCVAAVPALVGAPYPITPRQAISVGRSAVGAGASAVSIAAGS